ncbi:hypothetical protein IKG20_00875 [Candidatus Saccharibacteria bacterium]|nr:hypothetical protein [Candidatus Saccharibacteria bacterium]
MFDAVLSEDGTYVTLIHEDGEPEEMDTYEFTLAYGTDILKEEGRKKRSKLVSGILAAKPSVNDVEQYWKAFRRLTKNCGEYAHKVALLRNAEEGIIPVQKVAYDYFGGPNSDRNLSREIVALDCLRATAVANLDYWSRRVGFKPMSTPGDVKRYHLTRRADTEILLEHLSKPDFRKRIYRRIDKYAKKGESKSPAELVMEVLLSYKKKSRQPS